MQLIECYIENFGTYREYSCKFDRGLNCIVSDNGSGKTTLSMFIASMLYGLSESKRQSLEENERKKFFPWQGGRFGGSLTFSARGNTYIVERTFGTKPSDDQFTLRLKSSGAVSTDFTENLGGELFGVDREGFLRTVFLSEKNLSAKNDNKSISAKLSDLVGVDGDLGGVDAALDLLDKRRKFYYKQSGNCEINNVKSLITEKKLELDRLGKIYEGAVEKGKKLTALAEENAVLSQSKKALEDKISENAKQKERAACEERYSAMLAKVKSDRIKLTELEEFFGGNVPEAGRIEEARFMLYEGRRLKAELEEEKGKETIPDEKFSSLSFDVLGEVDSAYTEFSTISSEVQSYESGADEWSVKMKSLFPREIPEKSGIDECKKLYGKSGVLFSLLLGCLGFLSILVGVVLGTVMHPMVYILSAVGVIVCAIGAFSAVSKIKKGKDALKRLIFKSGRMQDAPTHESLYRIEADLEIYRELEHSRSERLSYISSRYNELLLSLNNFINEFSDMRSGRLGDDIERIRIRYTEYYASIKARNTDLDMTERRMLTAREMITKANAFLSNYETKTEDPFGELSSLVAEYGYTKLALERGIRECDEYAQKYGTTGEYIQMTSTDPELDAKQLAIIDTRMSEITREYGILNNEYERDMRECEKIESAEAELCELRDTLDKYNANLKTIKDTAALLSEACDNMTSRYIGKTRDAFIKYENLIGGVGGEYAVDTNFVITKSERGSQRGEECYSRGTRDLFAFSLRLALIDTLFEDEKPFIILDDPFIAFDDDKCKRARKVLSEIAKNKQIIYFTCSSSRTV